MTEGFPIADCTRCGHAVLAYREPGGFRCLHCDGELADVELAPYEALEALGYGFVDGGKQGKCASGGTCSVSGARVEGPGSGGCGGGTCGHEAQPAGCATCEG